MLNVQMSVFLLGREEGDDANTFYALGRRTLKPDLNNAVLGVEILPNLQSQLKRAFVFNMVTSLELMDKLPPVGSGLTAWAEVKSKTLRFMMTKFQPVPLPPVGKSIEQRKARKKAVTEAIAAATTAAKQVAQAQGN